MRRGERKRIVVANLGPGSQRVKVIGLQDRVRVRHLDETCAVRAMREPEAFRVEEGIEMATSNGTVVIDLLPYACVCIDSSR